MEEKKRVLISVIYLLITRKKNYNTVLTVYKSKYKYMPVRGTDFAFSTIILLDFGTIPSVVFHYMIYLKKGSLNSDFRQNKQLPITLNHRT